MSVKAALDGFVKAGILIDDSAEYVSEVRHIQHKSKEEKTVFIFEWE